VYQIERKQINNKHITIFHVYQIKKIQINDEEKKRTKINDSLYIYIYIYI